MAKQTNGNKAMALIDEMKELEEKIRQLKIELGTLQADCVHEFVSNQLMKTCQKCLQSESIYY
ncbi:hypothetical protein [Ammoniphilus sp. CFH 90114]|uniref:hypothetical protein n=1 Tax=Ammoniphilus sp. CFH 90114 TaxID=2493665 RepID=UPI00100DFB58|nr:hypothetical protein [Ammoniphilus sp. CFH 90114]RXT04176.1 hypothetical protein EIZ39_21620 [Ammoniphilus sp. CFH 90114]